MNTSFILMALSASSLPLLAFLALLLRRKLFSGVWKIIFLTIGLFLLTFAVFETFVEHSGNLSIRDVLIGGVTASFTVLILSKFNHGHSHVKEAAGAKGIVISEAFHSLLDGGVIGATYLVNPFLGYAATIGIITHELPKVLGTLAVLRSLGHSMKKTILYGVLAQIGSPVSALLIYILGKKFDASQFHALEIASVSSLAAIVIWIIYLEIQFHRHHDHENGHSHGSN